MLDKTKAVTAIRMALPADAYKSPPLAGTCLPAGRFILLLLKQIETAKL
jgi:hypothetical protein